jgi:hypothetical protein
MKRIMLATGFLVLGACQSAPTTFNENSGIYPPPVGTRFSLKQDLVVPAHSAHVDLQDGQTVSLHKLNQYHPYCRLDVQDVRDTPQTLTPDEFVVKRVYRQTTDLVAQQSDRFQMIRVSEMDGGPTFMIYRTVFDLSSMKQPQVRRMTCERWDRPSLGEHVSLREIRTALGNYFSVTLPGAADTKSN